MLNKETENPSVEKKHSPILSVLQAEVVEQLVEVKSVLLPLKTTAKLPQDVKVEWRRTDPKHVVVHVYQNDQNQPSQQDKVYRGRTDMEEEPLKTGDLSLTLKDLRLTDSGVYICTVSMHGRMLQQKVVTLSVKGQQTELFFHE